MDTRPKKKQKLPVKKEYQLAEGPKNFGEANSSEVTEVKPPNEDDIVNVEGNNHQEVEIVAVKEAPCFSHPREACPQYIFGTDNHLVCDKCYCTICGVPATECENWFSSKSYVENHCNAHSLHKRRIDNTDVRQWKLMHQVKKNPLFAMLVNMETPVNSLTPREFLKERELVECRMDRSFHLYEAGEKKIIVDAENTRKEILHHNFAHVTSSFQKLFFATRLDIEDKNWIHKFIILDAMSEVIVGRTWRKPEGCSEDNTWDTEAEKTYKRIILSLGSRWFSCFAHCHESKRLQMAKVVETRVKYLQKLSSGADMVQTFQKGFEVVLQLVQQRYNIDSARENTLDAVRILFSSMLKRFKHHVDLPASDTNRRSKFQEIGVKDRVMFPFLESIKKYVQRPIHTWVFGKIFPMDIVRHLDKFLCGKTPIKYRQVNTLCDAKCNEVKFYMFPTIENWRMVKDKELMFWMMKKLLDNSTYTFSTRRVRRFESILNLTELFFDIAIENQYSDPNNNYYQVSYHFVLKGMKLLTEMYAPPVEALMVKAGVLFMKKFAYVRATRCRWTEKGMKTIWTPLSKLLGIVAKLKDYENENKIIKRMFRLVALEENPFLNPMSWPKLCGSFKVHTYLPGSKIDLEQGAPCKKVGENMFLVGLQTTITTIDECAHTGEGVIFMDKKEVIVRDNATFMSIQEVEALEFWHRKDVGSTTIKLELIWQQI